MSRRILVADDSSTIQKVIKIAFARYAIEIVEAGSYIEALAAVGRARIDALILDASLPGARGPADFAKILGDARGAPMLLLVGTYEVVDENAFRQAGFQHFLKKPFESTDIVAVLDRLLGGELGVARTVEPQAGPLMPPLPGSANRIQHATVIHQGGLGGLTPRARKPAASPPPAEPVRPPPARNDEAPWSLAQDDDADEEAQEDLPAPPTDHARKGRRAFSTGGEGARQPGGVPPPPMSLRLDDDQDPGTPRRGMSTREPSPLPPIPPGTGFGAAPDGDGDGLALPLPEDVFHAPPARGSTPAREAHVSSGKSPVGGGFRGADDVRALVEAQLPELVAKGIQEYCERHFKSLAREIIAAELRRLADEKARQLVDN